VDQIIKKRMSERFHVLWEGLNWLTDWRCEGISHSFLGEEDHRLDILQGWYVRSMIPSYEVRSLYRSVIFSLGSGDVRAAYVSRCLGHCVPDRVFFPFPKLCVLLAVVLEGGRWRAGESVISGDDEACLFYSRMVFGGGRLPWDMHNRVVLRSFGGGGAALRRYFGGFTAQKTGL
jgi:hypothetical protein